jgi:hypothetical protein
VRPTLSKGGFPNASDAFVLWHSVRDTAALAVSPHFVSASANVSGANLSVSFKEAGLGTNQLITYQADANATATYVCVNKGGANPRASNKTNVSGPVSGTGTFNSGRTATCRRR